MSESPRILGVSFISEDTICGAVFLPADLGEHPSLETGISSEFVQESASELEIFPEISTNQLSSVCAEHQISEIRVLMSSAEECWVQIPELANSDLHKEQLSTIALLLDLNQSVLVEHMIHPLGIGCPLSILMRSELLERCSRKLPQSIPHDFFTEASVIPFVKTIENKIKTGHEAQEVVMLVSNRHLSAFLLDQNSEKRGAVLKDAVRIPFEHVQDLPYLVRNVMEYYPWLPAIPLESELDQWPMQILSPSDLVGILASRSRGDLESMSRKETRRIEL